MSALPVVEGTISPSLRETLAGRSLLVTGFTGFLAKVLVAKLLTDLPELGQITILARPRGSQSGAERVAVALERSPCFRALRARHGAGLGAFLAERVQVVEGDVSVADLGLDAAALASLAGVDAVINSAGLTDFSPDPNKAVAANVTGALNAAALAERLGAALVHVSTCYVAGVADGQVPERVSVGQSPNGTALDVQAEWEALRTGLRARLRKGDRVIYAKERAAALGWPNIYTYTKALAEHLLHARVAESGLSMVIVRPSIVECAVEEPFAGWNEGLNTTGPLAWLITTAYRRLPTVPTHRFDVVPVDLVCRGLLLALAAQLRGECPQVVQLGTSAVNPLTFERAVELTGLGARRWARTGKVDPWFKLTAHLDPVPAPEAGSGWASVGAWHKRAKRVLTAIDEVEGLPKWAQRPRERARSVAGRSEDMLRRVDGMLELYKPFIHDFNWIFQTDHALALTAALPEAERAQFGFDPARIDWCDYWVNVEYPGLQTYSIPLLSGERAPEDPPARVPLVLRSPVKEAVSR